jgi:hypothetical protein
MDAWEAVKKQLHDYIAQKKLKPGFSYKDVWHEEHASAFTVAKAMQIDVLNDLKKAVEQAVEGQSFETFKKNIKPVLRQKGWWGKKEMADPLTGETVNAQLGSDRRLKTIYDVNMRSAYNKQHYDSIMENDSLPYMIYRVGASVHHRPEHLAWDGLILPKNDPFWALHAPQKEYGCRCEAYGITEWQKEKYQKDGVPGLKRDGGGTIPAKTEAPPEKFFTYFNERKGTVEQVPAGVHPSFNYDIRETSRNTAAFENLVQKTREKAPEQFDLVMSSIIKNKVNKTGFYGFIEDALERKRDRQYTAPVGFLDSKITGFLEKKGVSLGNHNIIILESKLVNGKKFTGKHTRMGNAPTKEDWYNLLDWLMDAPVYWDSKGLIYLAKTGGSRYMKIAIDLSLDNETHRGVRFFLPKIDTMYVLDLAEEGDRGSNEYNRIMKFEKIR